MLPLLVLLLASLANAISLHVSTTGGNASSPLLYGFMFEDINFSGDGGLHGQLLRNNGFQGTSPGLTAWSAVGGTTLAVDTSHPLSTALPQSLRISVPAGSTGQVGAANEGYFGIAVTQQQYAFYFWIEGAYAGDVTAQLVSIASGTVFGAVTVAVNSVAGNFTLYETWLDVTSSAPNELNHLQFLFDGSKVAGGALWVSLLQLFPVTFHQRFNGLKPDIAGALQNVQASFLRFPGGNNLEGATVADRWKWNETIGPLQNRPGRQGDWGYPNTDALGLLEYLIWCEDMSLAPILGVWDGLTLGGGVVTGAALTPYIQDVLNEIEYIIGDTSTTFGALRAAHGHADPFPLEHIEIGNEDFLSGGLASYAARFTAFHDAISSTYPELTIIASTDQGLPNPLQAGVWKDIHYYLEPNQLVAMFNQFDHADRTHGIFIGEYSAQKMNSGAVNFWPSLIGAVSEAVFMIGMERNSDVVKMASYAPLLERLNHQQWTPDLVQYSSNPLDLTLSTSYYNQQMFSVNRGTTILPVTSDTGFGPAYWVASRNDNTGMFFVKLANYGASTQAVTITIPGTSAGQWTVLTGPSEDSINVNQDPVVVPVTKAISGSGGVFAFTMPAWSVVVLAVK